MKRKNLKKKLLQFALLINIILIFPLALRKKPIKDWIIVYLFNALTNGIIDNILSRYRIVKYPIRLFSKVFDIHILFDFFLYPTFTIIYNQWTYRNNIFQIIYKLILITIPPFFIELWAENKTNLINWNKKWKWYHSYFSIILKSLTTRFLIGIIRWIDNKQHQNE